MANTDRRYETINCGVIDSIDDITSQMNMASEAINLKIHNIALAEEEIEKFGYGKHIIALALGGAACRNLYRRLMVSKNAQKMIGQMIRSLDEDRSLLSVLKDKGVSGARELYEYFDQKDKIVNNRAISPQEKERLLKKLEKSFSKIRPKVMKGLTHPEALDTIRFLRNSGVLKKNAEIFSQRLRLYNKFETLIEMGDIKGANNLFKNGFKMLGFASEKEFAKALGIKPEALTKPVLAKEAVVELETAYKSAGRLQTNSKMPKNSKFSRVKNSFSKILKWGGRGVWLVGTIAIGVEIFGPGEVGHGESVEALKHLNESINADSGLRVHKIYSNERKVDLIDWGIEHARSEEERNFFISVKKNKYDIISSLKNMKSSGGECYLQNFGLQGTRKLDKLYAEEMQDTLTEYAESIILEKLENAQKNMELNRSQENNDEDSLVQQSSTGMQRMLSEAQQDGSIDENKITVTALANAALPADDKDVKADLSSRYNTRA